MEKKTAIITGASSGIGKDHVHMLIGCSPNIAPVRLCSI